MAKDATSDRRPVLLRQSIRPLTADLQRHGFSAYRAKQIFHWLYKHAVESLEEMKNVPGDVRDWLGSFYRFGGGRIVDRCESSDGSIKFLFELNDGSHVESVLIHDKERRSLCMSSQVGCALACRFCLTGESGFIRNCASDEILGQYLAAKRFVASAEPPITHIVFMGMGEPLLNCDELFEAVRRLTDPQAVGLSPRRITVSTVGIVDGIRKLGEADLGVKLAVSLNATTDEMRSKIIPYNRRDGLADVLEACRRFPMGRRHRITIVYVLLAGVNDSPQDAHRLGKLLHGIRCKVNLIPFNPVPGALQFARPPEERTEAFQRILLEKDYIVSVRYSKGTDVAAACGQLAGHVER